MRSGANNTSRKPIGLAPQVSTGFGDMVEADIAFEMDITLILETPVKGQTVWRERCMSEAMQ